MATNIINIRLLFCLCNSEGSCNAINLCDTSVKKYSAILSHFDVICHVFKKFDLYGYVYNNFFFFQISPSISIFKRISSSSL